MKAFSSLTTALSALLALTLTSVTPVQGGNTLSHVLIPRNNDPNRHFQNTHPNGPPMDPPPTVPHLEWNSQIGHNQQSRQGSGGDGSSQQFQPYANFALQNDDTFQQQQQQQQQLRFASGTQSGGSGGGCRTRDRVYLPDMQSFLIQTPLTYAEAVQACVACGSELVLVDGTNVDRFREAFSSLGLYGDQQLWIKSWYGEQVHRQGSCPGVYVNAMMGNRLE
ncbi:hypothetical protein BGZ58_005331, partial [Dissophora ornata]